MDIKEFGDIIKNEGGKIFVVEDGRPIFVVLPFGEYKKNVKTEEAGTYVPFETKLASESYRSMPKELEDEPLKIEDLPV